jgi:uncharacterized membrane protein YedE/YeeE
MNPKELTISFAIIFVVAFITNAIVVYVWNLVRHGEGTFEWTMSLIIAIVFGITLTSVDVLSIKRRRSKE